MPESIWTCGVWGTATNSNKEIIQTFQNKYLRINTLINDTLHHDLNVYVRDGIKKLSQRYADRLEQHSNILAIDLTTPKHHAD